MNKITATHAEVIATPMEVVWDYTQNWGNRPQWDWSVRNAGTLWTQHNTLVLRQGFWAKLAAPVLKFFFTAMTKSIMRRAKKSLENKEY